MTTPGFDFTNARILVSNDDGIHAAGLGVLETIARSLTDDVWVVAPETERDSVASAPGAGGPERRSRR